MLPPIPTGWKKLLAGETRQPYYRDLATFVENERRRHEVLPAVEETFLALELTPPRLARVLILGQDPYPTPGHAHGLAFSVRPGVKPPASLRNIFKELHADLGVPVPETGYLVPWAGQGVLLLNAVLTVRAGKSNSHAGRGWEQFTDAVIRALSRKRRKVVFVLWGAYAQKKTALIDTARHAIIAAPHPSPLSAKKGFFGSRPFSRINAELEASGQKSIDWSL
ncbi:MAG TPA: uracil-DNA glycosylase [Longimicrobiales bacterium]|nr:uracil-DNA glycosylase [Longimicrobiales bacterium]